MLPFSGNNKVTSTFGVRTLNGSTAHHAGLDIVGVDSRDVLAVKGGKVVQSRMITDKSNRTWEWGNYVCVQLSDGLYHYYCHMDSRSVKEGDIICEGDKIGVMGNTGHSFGAHLHFEVRNAGRTSLDPTSVLGIPNSLGLFLNSDAAPKNEQHVGKQTCAKLKIYGVSKGLNVQIFTGRDVNLVAKDSAGQDIRMQDGLYDVLSLEGDASGYKWCKINYHGSVLFMPYGGVLDDRCQMQ